MNETASNDESSLNAGSQRGAAFWLATGLGIGLVGPAPGTLGALQGLIVAWGLSYLTPVPFIWVSIVVMFAIGVPLCTLAARLLGGKDPQPIVWDELATVPVVFILVPFTDWKIGVLGFCLHRLFDITKPWPCQRLERLPEGLGIMADDLAASIYAAFTLWAIVWLLPWF